MKKALSIILAITLLMAYIPQPVSAAVPKAAFKVTGNELGYKYKAGEGSPSGIRDGWIPLYNIIKGQGTSGCTVKAVVNKKTYQAKVNKQGRFAIYIPVQKTIYKKVTLKAGTKIKVTEYKGKKKVKTITVKAQKKGKHDKLIDENGIDYKWILASYDRLMTEYLAEYSEKNGFSLQLAWDQNYKKQWPRTSDDFMGAGFQLIGYDKEADVMLKMSERAIVYDMLCYATTILVNDDEKNYKLEKGKSYLYFNNYYYEGYNKWHAYGASARRGDKSTNIKSYNFITSTSGVYDAETLMEAAWNDDWHTTQVWVEKTDAYGKDIYYVFKWEGMPIFN